MRALVLCAGLVAVGTAGGTEALAEDAQRAAILSHSCNSCHGAGGYSPGAIPSLQGLSEEMFVRAMRDFKSGARPGTIMNRIARGYRDDDFVLMARYFQSQQQ